MILRICLGDANPVTRIDCLICILRRHSPIDRDHGIRFAAQFLDDLVCGTVSGIVARAVVVHPLRTIEVIRINLVAIRHHVMQRHTAFGIRRAMAIAVVLIQNARVCRIERAGVVDALDLRGFEGDPLHITASVRPTTDYSPVMPIFLCLFQ